VDVYVGSARQQTLPVKPMKWDLHQAALALGEPCGRGLDVSLAMRQKPEVRGRDVERPEMLVDSLELESKAGLRLALGGRLLMAAIPLGVFAFAGLIGLSGRMGAILAAASALIGLALLRLDPVPILLAVPRLGPFAFLAGLLAHRLARGWAGETPARVLAGLVLASTAIHGAWVFLPTHVPPDIYIHQQRALDLARVPLSYQGFLNYGSHFPTPSQDRGQATEALGTRMRIPYSPLPYLGYFALHLLGLDLAWAMTAVPADQLTDDQKTYLLQRFFDVNGKIVARFPRLGERQHQLAGLLSGGEQQLLALNRALLSRPRLLILDEPSMGLAPKMVENIFAVIAGLRERGVALLLIEQNARLALEVTDSAWVMDSGSIVHHGESKALLDDDRIAQIYLGEMPV